MSLFPNPSYSVKYFPVGALEPIKPASSWHVYLCGCSLHLFLPLHLFPCTASVTRICPSSCLRRVHFYLISSLVLKIRTPPVLLLLIYDHSSDFAALGGVPCLSHFLELLSSFCLERFAQKTDFSQDISNCFQAFILSFRLRLAEYVNKKRVYVGTLWCVWLKVSICCGTKELRGEELPFSNRLFSFHPSLLSLHIKRSAPKGPIRTAKLLY